MGYKHKYKKPAEHRFFNHINQTDYCWLWTGSLNGENGYGMFYDGTSRIYAHRFSYQIHKNSIPLGMVVKHECDNRKCVNPDHLEVGTQKENMRDAQKRGRLKLPKFTKLSKLRFEKRKLCKQGHDISSSESVYVNPNRPSAGRICRICNNRNQERWRKEKQRKEIYEKDN